MHTMRQSCASKGAVVNVSKHTITLHTAHVKGGDTYLEDERLKQQEKQCHKMLGTILTIRKKTKNTGIIHIISHDQNIELLAVG